MRARERKSPKNIEATALRRSFFTVFLKYKFFSVKHEIGSMDGEERDQKWCCVRARENSCRNRRSIMSVMDWRRCMRNNTFNDKNELKRHATRRPKNLECIIAAAAIHTYASEASTHTQAHMAYMHRTIVPTMTGTDATHSPNNWEYLLFFVVARLRFFLSWLSEVNELTEWVTLYMH